MLLERLGSYIHARRSPPLAPHESRITHHVSHIGVPLFFLFVSSVLLWPIVYAGEVPYWGGTLLQFYPWRRLVAEMLHAGQLPLWNPYLGLGAPLAANLQSAVFYPPTVLFLLFPVEKALGYSNVLHVALAGMGTYLFCRSLGVSRFAGLIGGLTYMLSGFVVARLIFPGHVDAMVWLPLVLYAVERVVQSAARMRNPVFPSRWMVLGAFLLAMLLLAGHMQVAFYSAWVIAGYSLLRIVQVAYRSRGEKVALWRRAAVRTGLWLGLMALLGVGLSAVQLLLTGELAFVSARAADADRNFMFMYSLWPWQLFNILAPDSFGSPASGNFWGPGNYWEAALYIGVLPLLLAFFGLRRQHWCLSLFFALLAVVSLLLALGWHFPFYPFVFDHVPGFSLFQAPTRLIFLYVLAMAVLAAFGADRVFGTFDPVPLSPSGQGENERFLLGVGQGLGVRSDARGKSADKALVGTEPRHLAVAGYRSSAVGVAIVIGSATARIFYGEMLGIRVTIVDGLLRFGIFLFLAGLVLSLRARVAPRLVQAAALLLVLVDLLSAGIPLNPATDAAVYRLPSPSAQYLAAAAASSRVFTPEDAFLDKFFGEVRLDTFGSSKVEDVMRLRERLIPNLTAAEHLYEVYNYDPLELADVNALRMAVERSGFPDPALSALNVAFVLSDTAPSPRFGTPVEIGLAKAYPVSQTLRRAYVVAGATVVQDHEDALAAFVSPSFQPASTVILEQKDLSSHALALPKGTTVGPIPTSGADAAEGWAEIEEYGAQRVRVRTFTEKAGFLVLSDAYYPGWKALVDGQPVPVLRADYALRAVPISAGEHLVEFVYDPPLLKLGLVIGSLSLLVSLWLLVHSGRDLCSIDRSGVERLLPLA